MRQWIERGYFEFAVALFEGWSKFPGVGQVQALDVLRRPWDDKRVGWAQRFGIDPTDDPPKRAGRDVVDLVTTTCEAGLIERVPSDVARLRRVFADPDPAITTA